MSHHSNVKMGRNSHKFTRRHIIQMGFNMSLLSFLYKQSVANSVELSNTDEMIIDPQRSLHADPIQRIIPSSGEKITAIGLGTWISFDIGTSISKRERLKNVLKILVEKNGSIIDSSPMYGTSEQVVGELSEELKIRHKLFFATKVWTSGRQNGVEQMDDSFARMRTQTMNLMQVHNLVDAESHIRTLKEWQSTGKIKYWGVTHYLESAIPSLIAIIKKHKPDFVQFSYSIRNREAEKQLLPQCKDEGVAVIINRPFDGGSLFDSIKDQKLPAWVAEYDIKTWAQFFLKFIISHPAVTAAIPGTSNPDHMSDNILAAYGKLPDTAARHKMAGLLNSF